jgi:hypothetical protein
LCLRRDIISTTFLLLEPMQLSMQIKKGGKVNLEIWQLQCKTSSHSRISTKDCTGVNKFRKMHFLYIYLNITNILPGLQEQLKP